MSTINLSERNTVLRKYCPEMFKDELELQSSEKSRRKKKPKQRDGQDWAIEAIVLL